MSPYCLAVANTASGSFAHLVHDAARPFAVVGINRRSGRIKRVVSRHKTSHGASIACGRLVKLYPTLKEAQS